MPVPQLVLNQLPLLAGLPQVTLAHLAQQCSERAFAKREVVLQKGSEGGALCFLIEGRLQGVDFTVDGREVGLYFVNPGDYFGDIAVIDGETQPVYVTAVSRSRVVFVPRDLIRPILFAHAKLAEVLCTSLSQRVRQLSGQRRILGMVNPVQRVCAQLELMMVVAPDSAWVRNAPTHQELAIMINASRETVTRVFQLLQSRGVVERSGNDLRVDNTDFIRDVASGRKPADGPAAA
ncbi:Crp/Fnr family transcriptional regulator [Caenimonas aquaedulcis]|uniref:Crp/Fnr family transcriptional regulator n=1 Tax=Caenimonas aquaedulcis TaxID=2793270 RepID=A0A931H6W3_9BURK|nr:Crp/Fnr family transcriptional regulator [Caenimonas aquaedulcis]MBG9389784.1 Crp/Fnr family transcriptional regulator [Caenimonas aquaedulcis]